MGVTLEPLKKEIIQKNIDAKDNVNRVEIIGCLGCAAISCCLNGDGSRALVDFRMRPESLQDEMEELKSALEQDYEKVEFNHIMTLCRYSKRKDKKIKGMARDADAIVVMSCPAGIETVKKATKADHILAGMRVKGFKSIGVKVKGLKVFVEGR